MATNKIHNFAFISYNHRDVQWAKWLRRKLEWYRLPSEIHNEFDDSRFIRPVFRDRDELNAGILGAELRKRLEASKFLIVICSPNSAHSDWVSDEVKAFIEMGRLEYIIPFIVDGEPQNYVSAEAASVPIMGECFPKALRQWNIEHPQESLLGIAVNDDGSSDRQKAFIRVVSRMLGVDFDTLWKRRKREVRRMMMAVASLSLICLALIYWFMIPVNLSVTIKGESSNLPEMNTAVLSVGGNEYSVTSMDTTVHTAKLPGYCRMGKLPVSFNADRFYVSCESEIDVTAGISQSVVLNIKRDNTFAEFAGIVYCLGSDDELLPLADAVVTIGNQASSTDAEGHFKVVFDVADQSEAKAVSISHDGYKTYIREDEVPDSNLRYILHRE
ncbi:MAG: toll/interleukin-1 receptor domain-containing protein [Bacteroidales bacterium]|nr:toll/interleukin-1 receptor domain-containing protein [Candidatus Liminaster caballi]